MEVCGYVKYGTPTGTGGVVEYQLPFALQVKNFKRNPSVTLLMAYREALGGAGGKTPVGAAYLPVDKDRAGREWLACVSLETLAELIARAHGYRVQNEPEPYRE